MKPVAFARERETYRVPPLLDLDDLEPLLLSLDILVDCAHYASYQLDGRLQVLSKYVYVCIFLTNSILLFVGAKRDIASNLSLLA